MTDIAQHRATTEPAVMIGIAAAISTGQLDNTDRDVYWPSFEAPPFVTNHECRTPSSFEKSLALSKMSAAQDFWRQIAAIYTSVSSDQEPLGTDFEAVWDTNISQLFES